jgi:hypothetical protein
MLNLEEFKSLESKYDARFQTIVECCKDIRDYGSDQTHWILLSHGFDSLREKLDQQDKILVSDVETARMASSVIEATKKKGRARSKK